MSNQRQPVDLEHLPAQWLSAHGNTEGATWVYDAAAELERLRDQVTKQEEQQTHTEGCVMDEIAGAGLAGHVCDDDDLPDMVRHALDAAKQLAQPALAPEPGYERIADAIADALRSADLLVEVKTGTGSDFGRFSDSYSKQLYVLARTLDKAGLIDWSAFGQDGAA